MLWVRASLRIKVMGTGGHGWVWTTKFRPWRALGYATKYGESQMKDRVMIPEQEYGQRITKVAKLVADEGLDVLIANSNEADFANVRYFSGYWPLFEIGGVAIAPSGQAALMIGPESMTYAQDRSKISNIHRMLEYRDPAFVPQPSAQQYG